QLNDSLKRSVSERFMRGKRAWSHWDGLTRVTDATGPVLAPYRLTARAYSLSARQPLSRRAGGVLQATQERKPAAGDRRQPRSRPRRARRRGEAGGGRSVRTARAGDRSRVARRDRVA